LHPIRYRALSPAHVCRRLRRPSAADATLPPVPGTLRVSRPLRCPAFGTASGPTYLSVRSGFSRVFSFRVSLSLPAALRHCLRHDILSPASPGLFRSFCFRAFLSFLPRSGAVSHDILSSASPVFSVRFASVLSYSFLPRSGTASGMTFFRRRPRSFRFVLLPCFLILSCRAFRHSVRHDILSSASPVFSVRFASVLP